jgi:hypothetical protein
MHAAGFPNLSCSNIPRNTVPPSKGAPVTESLSKEATCAIKDMRSAAPAQKTDVITNSKPFRSKLSTFGTVMREFYTAHKSAIKIAGIVILCAVAIGVTHGIAAPLVAGLVANGIMATLTHAAVAGAGTAVLLSKTAKSVLDTTLDKQEQSIKTAFSADNLKAKGMAAITQIEIQIESSKSAITDLIKDVPKQLMGEVSDGLKSKFAILEQLGALDTRLTAAPDSFKSEVKAFNTLLGDVKNLLEKGIENPTSLFTQEFVDKLADLESAGSAIFDQIKNPPLKEAMDGWVSAGDLPAISDTLLITVSKVVAAIKAPIKTVIGAIKAQEKLIGELKGTLTATRDKIDEVAKRVDDDGKACLTEIGAIRDAVKSPHLGTILKAGWGILKLLKNRDAIKADLSAAMDLPKTATEFRDQLKALVVAQKDLITGTFSKLKGEIEALHTTLSSGAIGAAISSEATVLGTEAKSAGTEVALDAIMKVVNQAQSALQQQVQMVAVVAFQSTKSAVSQVLEEAGGPLASGVKAAMRAEKKGEALVSALKAVKEGTGSADSAALVLQDILNGEDVSAPVPADSPPPLEAKAEDLVAKGKATATLKFEQLMTTLEGVLTSAEAKAATAFKSAPSGAAEGTVSAEPKATTAAVETNVITVAIQETSSNKVNLDTDVKAEAASCIAGATPTTAGVAAKISKAWQNTKTRFSEFGAMAKAHPVRTVLAFAVVPVITALSIASLGTDAGVHGLWHAAHHMMHTGVASVKGFLEKKVVGGLKQKIDAQEKRITTAFSADNIRAKGEEAIRKIEAQIQTSEAAITGLLQSVPTQLLGVLTTNFTEKLTSLIGSSTTDHAVIAGNLQAFKGVLADVPGLFSAGMQSPETMIAKLGELEAAGTALFASVEQDGALLPAASKEIVSSLSTLIKAITAPVKTLSDAIQAEKTLIQTLRGSIQSTRDQIQNLATQVEADMKSCLSEIKDIRTAIQTPIGFNITKAGLGLLSLLRQRTQIEKDISAVKALPKTVEAFRSSLLDLVSQQKVLLSGTKEKLLKDLEDIRTAAKETDFRSPIQATGAELKAEGLADAKSTGAAIADELEAVITGALKTVQTEIQGVVSVAFTATKEAATQIITEATGPLGKIMKVIQNAKQGMQAVLDYFSADKKEPESFNAVINQLFIITGDAKDADPTAVQAPASSAQAASGSVVGSAEAKVDGTIKKIEDLSHEKLEALMEKLSQLLKSDGAIPATAPAVVASASTTTAAATDAVQTAATTSLVGATPATPDQVQSVTKLWPRTKEALSFLGSKAVSVAVRLVAFTVAVVVSIYRAHELKIPLLHDLMHKAMDKITQTAKSKFETIEREVTPIAKDTLATLKGRVATLVIGLEATVAAYPEKLLEAVESGAASGVKSFLNQEPTPLNFDAVVSASDALPLGDKSAISAATQRLSTIQARITAQIQDLQSDIAADGTSGGKIAETLISDAFIQKMTYLEQLVTQFNAGYTALGKTLRDKGINVALPVGSLMKEHPVAAFLQSIATIKSTVSQTVDTNVAEVKAQIKSYQALVGQIESTEKEIKTLTDQTRQLYADFTSAGVIGKLKLATTWFLRRDDYKKAVDDVQNLAKKVPDQIKTSLASVASAGKTITTVFKESETSLAKTGKAMVQSFAGESSAAASGLATAVSSGIKSSMHASLQSFVGDLETQVMTALHEIEGDLTASAEKIETLVADQLALPDDVKAKLQEMIGKLKEAKTEVLARREEAKTESAAATKLQAFSRGRKARKDVKTLKDAAVAAQAAQLEKEQEAATKLQSQFRRYKARTEFIIRRQEVAELKREEEPKLAEIAALPIPQRRASTIGGESVESRVANIEAGSVASGSSASFKSALGNLPVVAATTEARNKTYPIAELRDKISQFKNLEGLSKDDHIEMLDKAVLPPHSIYRLSTPKKFHKTFKYMLIAHYDRLGHDAFIKKQNQLLDHISGMDPAGELSAFDIINMANSYFNA